MKFILQGLSVFLLGIVTLSTSSYALCVKPLSKKKSQINLRQGPGTNHEITWKVPSYTPLKQIRRSGKWFLVQDMDGDKHWVYSSLVTSRYKCASVSRAEVNLREGPGTKFPKAKSFKALRYTSFKITKTKGSWIEIKEHKGGKYWLYKPLTWVQ